MSGAYSCVNMYLAMPWGMHMACHGHCVGPVSYPQEVPASVVCVVASCGLSWDHVEALLNLFKGVVGMYWRNFWGQNFTCDNMMLICTNVKFMIHCLKFVSSKTSNIL